MLFATCPTFLRRWKRYQEPIFFAREQAIPVFLLVLHAIFEVCVKLLVNKKVYVFKETRLLFAPLASLFRFVQASIVISKIVFSFILA